MNRILRKANMTRSNVKKRYNLDRTTINFQNIRNNAIFVSIFYVKKQYFHKIYVKHVTAGKKFWKTIRPKFSNECKTGNTIILV